MERVYHRYEEWEDFINGMYETEFTKEQETGLLQRAIQVLTNAELFEETLTLVAKEWPKSFEHNMSNPNCNRKAWLGQAACSFKYNVPEIITRKAWSMIADSQRYYADFVAKKFISNYESGNIKVHRRMEKEGLFRRDT